jgi:hypothetical protein
MSIKLKVEVGTNTSRVLVPTLTLQSFHSIYPFLDLLNLEMPSRPKNSFLLFDHENDFNFEEIYIHIYICIM